MKVITNKHARTLFGVKDFEYIIKVPLKDLYDHKDIIDGEEFGYWIGKLLYNGVKDLGLKVPSDTEVLVFDKYHYVYGIHQLSTDKYRIGETVSLYNRLWQSHGNGYFLKYDLGTSFIKDLNDFEFIIFSMISRTDPDSYQLSRDLETKFSELTKSYEFGFNGSVDGKGHHQNTIWVINIETGEYQRINPSDFDESKFIKLKSYRVYSIKTQSNYFIDIESILNNLDLELRFGYPKGSNWWTEDRYISRDIITKDNINDLLDLI